MKEWQSVETDPWKEFNDSTVSAFDLKKKLEEEAFGTKDMENTNATSDAMTDEQLAAFLSGAAGGQSKTYGKSAYMLVYERKSKKALRVFEMKGGKEESSGVSEKRLKQFFLEAGQMHHNKHNKQSKQNINKRNKFFLEAGACCGQSPC